VSLQFFIHFLYVASAVGKLLGCSGLVEPIGGGHSEWSR
jgi:hypothetical protein